MPIRWFVNALANSFGINEAKPGRNATSGSMNIIEQLRPNFQIISGKWSHFSYPSFAAAMPGYFERHCMKFTFSEFSEEIPPLQLTQAGSYLMAPRGYTAPEARICYERAESLCSSLNRPLLLYAALMGQWRHSNTIGKLSEALQIAKRLYALSQEHNESVLLRGACHALACTLYFLAEFESSRQYARRAIQIWRSEDVESRIEEVDAPITSCSVLCGHVRVAFRRDHLLPSEHSESDLTSEGAQ
jgi:hypothetical protein